MPDNRVVVGAFEKRAQAEAAMQALRDVGVRDDYIGFIVREEDGKLESSDTMPLDALEADNDELAKHAEADGSVAAGMMTGGVIGGVIGAAASLLIPGIGPAIAGGVLASTLSGMAVGAVTGGIIGPLVHMGVSEEDAHYYDNKFQAGRTIVIVQADEQPLEILQVMERYQALRPGASSSSTSSTPSSVSVDSSIGNNDPEATVELKTLE